MGFKSSSSHVFRKKQVMRRGFTSSTLSFKDFGINSTGLMHMMFMMRHYSFPSKRGSRGQFLRHDLF